MVRNNINKRSPTVKLRKEEKKEQNRNILIQLSEDPKVQFLYKTYLLSVTAGASEGILEARANNAMK